MNRETMARHTWHVALLAVALLVLLPRAARTWIIHTDLASDFGLCLVSTSSTTNGGRLLAAALARFCLFYFF